MSDSTNDNEPDVFGRVFRLKAPNDIKQRDAAAWNRAFMSFGNSAERMATAVERQASLQAAIEAGWILSPECRVEQVIDMQSGGESKRYLFDGVAVDDMRPSEVNYYGRLCSRAFDAVMAVPKATSSA